MTLPDLEKYRPFTKNFDLTDEEKDELIRTTWVILQHLVDQSFGVHPLQLQKKENENKHLT